MTAPLRPALRVEAFFDAATSPISDIVRDRVTGRCAIVDSVLDFDPRYLKIPLNSI